MKTVTIDGFISWRKSAYEGNPEFLFHPCDMTGHGYVMVKPYSFEVLIPDGFDPRQAQVDALEAEKKNIRAEFAARITQIDRQISELTCLEAA